MSSFDSLSHPASNPSTINNNNNNNSDNTTNGYQNGMLDTDESTPSPTMNGSNHHITNTTNNKDNTTNNTNTTSTTPTNDEILELRYLIDGSHVGAIIGKSGITVKYIRESSGAFLSIHQKDGRATERIMMVKGNIDQQVKAAELICLSLIEAYKEKRDAILSNQTHTIHNRELAQGTNDTNTLLRLLVHKSHVGAVIGRAGITIKDIQSHTGCKIQVSNDALPMSTEKSITFSGTPQAISSSIHSALIEMKNNPMKPNMKMTYYQPGNAIYQQSPPSLPSPYAAAAAAAAAASAAASNSPFLNPSLLLASQTLGFASAAAAAATAQHQQQSQSQRIAIPTVCAGLIIGKSGQTIKGLRAQSGCHIQIADPEINSPNERVVTITGTHPGINNAILLIRQLVERYVPPSLSNGLPY